MGDYFLGYEAVGAWSWPLDTIYCLAYNFTVFYVYLPNFLFISTPLQVRYLHHTYLTRADAINGSRPHERFTKKPIREALLFYPSYRELCVPPRGPVGRSCDFPSLATHRAASKNRLSSVLGPPTVASEHREVPAKKLPGPTLSSLQPPPQNLYELKFLIILPLGPCFLSEWWR